MNIRYLGLMSFWRLVLLESVILLLTVDILDGASRFGSVLCLSLAHAFVGAETVDKVGLISFLRFVIFESV